MGAANLHRRSPRLRRLWMELLESRRMLDGGPTTWHVDDPGSPDNSGLSWADATTLQAALGRAVSGDEIWVAAGTYKPTHESVPGNPRTAAFQLKNGVALYGGFDPSVGDTVLEDRDWTANAILSQTGPIQDISDEWQTKKITKILKQGNPIHHQHQLNQLQS